LRRTPDQRPEWWPAGEPWPHQPSRRPSHRFVLRAFAMMAVFLITVAALIATGAYAALVALGVVVASTAGRILAVAVLAAGIGCVTILARTMRRRIAPFTALIEAAARIERGDYAGRVPEDGGRELRALARSFNAMSERLETIDGRRRAFLADVAHELRTPLSLIRGRVEAMVDGVHARDDAHLLAVLDQAQALERLVGDVATVALAETGSLSLRLEPVDLALLADAVADDFGERGRAAGITVESAAAPAPVQAVVDPARLRQALANLVTNAIRHTPSGGRVELRATSVHGEASLAVADTGSGIPDALVDRVQERFVRDPDSPGSGLGLAIVAEIAAAHGGTVSVESSVGLGTTVTIALPRDTPPGG
jgi:two-component system sensor histidine kinase BaeS